MGDESQRTETPESEQDELFDEVLRKVAHASEPVASGVLLALRPGGTLLEGRLRILRRVGEGGMGVVYAAHDELRRGAVALKTLNRLDAGSVYRLKNEFRSLADVTHPNLCRLHELFGEGGQWFFTMELIEGERFDRWMRPGPANALDEERLRAALPQLVDAVIAIHEAGKLHRDLKPSNVLVTGEGRVVVLDFGLAVDPESGGVGQTLLDESVSGTPAYMAPEQAAGQPATAASDFYALGVMLFEALTGRLPFEGRAHEMLTDKQRADAKAPSALVPDVPADLDALCAELLSREAARRPGAETLCERLGAPASRARHALRAPRARDRSFARDAELLGREPELAALRDALAATVAGRSVVMVVSGASGMGKSALVGSFLDELRARGQATVLAGRCHERENVPFKGFDALVDDLSRHLRRLSDLDATAVLPREVFALARLFPVLDRIDAVTRAPKKNISDPHDLKRRAFEAFGELLGRLCDRTPLVVFIDDVQWLDQDSVRFMRSLLLHPRPIAALLVFAHRSEGAAANALLQSVLQSAQENPALDLRKLSIGPLPASALVALAARLLPADADEQTAARFADEAQGSPFFAAELARAAALRPRGVALPSLGDALALHVAALPTDAQRLLSLLALSGQPLATEVAFDAAGLSDGHDQLDRLRNEQLARVSPDEGGSRTVECYHDKIREHVAGTLAPPVARQLAAELARVLSARSDRDPELLVRCLDLAERPAEAAEHAALAAEAAYAALAFDRAAALYRRALAQATFGAGRAHELRAGLARALAHAGRGIEAAEGFLRAAGSAGPQEQGEHTLHAAEHYLLCGRLDEGRSLMAEALRPFGISMPKSTPAALTTVAYERLRLRLRGLAMPESALADTAAAHRLAVLDTVTHALLRCDPVRAAIFSARSVRAALDAGNAGKAARALGWEILITSSIGTSPAALAELTARALDLCERSGDPRAWEAFHFSTAYERMFAGDCAAAVERFDRCIALYGEVPQLGAFNRAWAELFRAYMLVCLGHVREVAEKLPAQVEGARSRSDLTLLPMLAGGLAALARIACGQDREAALEIERVGREWRPSEVTNQDTTFAVGACAVAMYAGDPRRAWEIMAALDRRLSASPMARTTMRTAALAPLAGAALGLAADTSDAHERRALMAIARRHATAVDRTRVSVVSTPAVNAGLASLAGDSARTLAALRAFSERSDIVPLTQQAARRRLGALLGGDEGARLIAGADAFMRAGGVVDAERLSAVLIPGIAGRS